MTSCFPDAPEAKLEEAIAAASDLLFEFSGHKYPGICRDVVRPCSRNREYSRPAWTRTIDGGTWQGFCGCNLGARCGCMRLPEVYLGATPLVSINSVKIDGVVLDPASYRIDDWRTLVRIDGDHLPCCQRIDLPDTEIDTFSVDFNYGQMPPASGKLAVIELAHQLVLACTGSDGCQLPSRVTEITRQGVSMVLLDPFNFFENGRTGIYVADAFLASVNPTGRRAPANISSPDIFLPVRRVGT